MIVRYILVCLTVFLGAFTSLHAEVEYEFQFVPYDAPDTLIHERVQKSITWTLFPYTLTESQQKMWSPPYACWIRNIKLNGKPLFEIYERGQYIDRRPIARPKLAKNRTYTIWPGDHQLKVDKDGKVSTKDPDLLISERVDKADKEGQPDRHFQVVKLKAYPITIQAKNADPRAIPPPSLFEEIPLPQLVIRDAKDNDNTIAAAKPDTQPKATELLPNIRSFLYLIAWLPANTQGKGYALYPLGETFHIGADGIKPGAGEGGYHVESWKADGYVLTIPMNQIPVIGSTGMDLLVKDVQHVSGYPKGAVDEVSFANLYNRAEPYEIRVSEYGSAIRIDGDLSRLPNKSLRIDWADDEHLYQRSILVETDNRHLDIGKPFQCRVSAIDPNRAQRLAEAANRKDKAVEAAEKQLKGTQNNLSRAQSLLDRVQPKAAAARRNMENFQKQLGRFQKQIEAEKAKGQKNKPRIDAVAKQLAAAQASLKTNTDLHKKERAAVASDPKVKKEQAKVDAVQKKVNEAEATLEKANQIAAAAHLAAEEAAKKNPLSEGKTFVLIRPHNGHNWKELSVTPQEDGVVTVSYPAEMEIRDGVFQMRIGFRPADPGQADIYLDQWVTLAAGQVNGIGSFTLRGRKAFYRGESFTLAVAVMATIRPIAIGTQLSVDLVDTGGVRLSLFKEDIKKEITERETFILNVPAEASNALAPGNYRIEARVGDRLCPPFVITIVDPAPETHFTNLLLGKYNNFGFHYSAVLGGKMEADEVAGAIAESGYNAFKGMTYAIAGRVQFPDGGRLAAMVRERPELGPWEAFAPASGRDQFLNACVKYNLRFYENLFTQHDSIMPRGDKMLQVCERFSTLEAQTMRHSPAFRGVCLFDELSHALDHDSHMAVLAYFRTADEMDFRQKYNGQTSSQALRGLDRFSGRPEGQRRYEDLQTFFRWPRHLDEQWETFSRRNSDAVRAVLPDSFNFTLSRCSALPGSLLGPDVGGVEPLFSPLQAVSSVGYKDMGGFGDFAVSGPLGADAFRVRDDIKVWPMLFGLGSGPFGSSNLRHAFFTLSQKVDGISFMQFESSPKAKPTDSFSAARDIAASLTTPYGDLFLALEKGYRKVAIVYSREADYIRSRKPVAPHLACEGLWLSCLRAGFPADFLTDNQLRADKGLDYDVIIYPGIFFKEEVHPDSMAALQRLKAAGKKIIVERQSRLALEGLIRMEIDLAEIDDQSGGTFPKHLDHDDERWWDMTVETTAYIRKFLSKLIPPAAEHDLLVGPDWQRCRQGEYLFIPNLAFTGFRGNHKTLYQAPAQPSIQFPKRPPACYDMLEMKRVEAPVSSDGKSMSLKIDFRNYPGKIYAFLPAAIDSVIIRAPQSVAAGGNLNYEIYAVDEQNQRIDAGIPFEIELYSEGPQAKRLLQKTYRAGTPAYRTAYTIPANLKDSLKLRVRELISGRVAEGSVAITAGVLPKAVKDTRLVRLHHTAEVKEFMTNSVKIARPLFTKDDLPNAGGLALRILDGEDKLSKDIRNGCAPETIELLKNYNEKDGATEALVQALVRELNKLVETGRLFTQERFPHGILTIEAGRIGQTVTDPEKLPELNRLLLEEYYSKEILRRHPIYIGVTEEWVWPQAERLRRALHARGLRVRATYMRPWLRAPGIMITADQQVNLDGTRLWRGSAIRPSVHVDAPFIVLGRRADMMRRLAELNLLPEPVSENFPGPGRSIVSFVRRGFSVKYDTVAVQAADEKGLALGVEALLNIGSTKTPVPPSRLPSEAPAFDDTVALRNSAGKEQKPSSFGDSLTFEDQILVLDADANNGRFLVGTAGYGSNIFCFSWDGKLNWKVFLPEHRVYHAQWIDGGRKVLAATGHGTFIFLLDGTSGKILRRFASTEWPYFHSGREHITNVKFVLNPKLRQVLIIGPSGVLAVDYDGKKMWFRDRAFATVDYPQEATQNTFAAFGRFVRPEYITPSPDGTKLIYNEFHYFASTMGFGGIIPLWRNEPEILDAKTSKVLMKNFSDPGSSDLWKVSWPVGSVHPWIHATNLSAPLMPTGKPGKDGAPDPGKLGKIVAPEIPKLKTGGILKTDYHSSARYDENGHLIWHHGDRKFWIVNYDRRNEHDTRLYRSSRDGLVRCINLSNGKTIWEQSVGVTPSSVGFTKKERLKSSLQHVQPGGISARLLPLAGDMLLAGTRNGVVARFDPNGKVVWQARLRDLNELPDKSYPEYLAQEKQKTPDATGDFYPTFFDTPDDYKKVLRMGIQQLDNGDFETDKGWKALSGEVQLETVAYNGKKSLKLEKAQLVTAKINRKVIPNATYLLEFFYRTKSSDTVMAAGAQFNGEKSTFTLSNFKSGRGQPLFKGWHFGRVAVKSLADTESIEIGFEAGNGSVNVDQVSFRPVRFPSANLLFNEELHKIEPTHPEDFRIKYARVPGELKTKLLSSNSVTTFMQTTPLGALVWLQEPSFLYNGRLDDVTPMWSYRPDPVGFAVVLTKPAYVSHLVLYLNNALPQMVYPNFSILANDMTTKVPKTVALVRGNRRRFIVVHIPETIYTDNFKFLPGYFRAHRDSLTEVEVYGPVGGPETLTDKKFDPDPKATAMFMGNAAHVRTALPEDFIGKYKRTHQHNFHYAPAFHPDVTVVNEVMTFAQALGRYEGIGLTVEKRKENQLELQKRRKAGEQLPVTGWRIGTVTPLTTPARYARRLLSGSADYKMHAVADNGAHIWAFETGGRVYSHPTPDKDEVYFGSDDGHLYKVDVDSGILIWEFKTGDRIRSSPALDGKKVYAASWDGHLYAVDMIRGTQVWKAPIAPFTRSSPALKSGRIYIGDEEGKLHCFNAGNGKSFWSADLNEKGKATEQISMCPLVTPEGIFAVTKSGIAALVATNGAIRWRKDLFASVRAKAEVPPLMTGQPFATKTQIILSSSQGIHIISRANGNPDTRFIQPNPPGNVVSVAPYGNKLCYIQNRTQLQGGWTRFIVDHGSSAFVWEPEVKK